MREAVRVATAAPRRHGRGIVLTCSSASRRCTSRSMILAHLVRRPRLGRCSSATPANLHWPAVAVAFHHAGLFQHRLRGAAPRRSLGTPRCRPAMPAGPRPCRIAIAIAATRPSPLSGGLLAPSRRAQGPLRRARGSSRPSCFTHRAAVVLWAAGRWFFVSRRCTPRESRPRCVPTLGYLRSRTEPNRPLPAVAEAGGAPGRSRSRAHGFELRRRGQDRPERRAAGVAAGARPRGCHGALSGALAGLAPGEKKKPSPGGKEEKKQKKKEKRERRKKKETKKKIGASTVLDPRALETAWDGTGLHGIAVARCSRAPAARR